MKKSICLYFQVHQPDRLRLFRFFDIGHSSYYFDDFSNRTILKRVAQKCYLPMNEMLLELVTKMNGSFKLAFSISGSAIEQFEKFAPEVLESFQKLAQTGYVEFLAETYSHSLASLVSEEEFKAQVVKHKDLVTKYFGKKPTAFRNTELIYSDKIGKVVSSMGFKTMLTEGAKHIMGWKSPNYVYSCAATPKLKLLLRNFNLSDDIAFRFSDKGASVHGMNCDQFYFNMVSATQNDEVVNLFMDYETFGEHQSTSSGIMEFMKYLPETVLKNGEFEFCTPTEAAAKHKSVGPLNVPYAISWADEERDTTAWLGNDLQNEAFEKINSIRDKVIALDDEKITEDYLKLQESDHFYYMCTKFFSDGAVHSYFNPYDSPYDAFINYMNVFSDLKLRIDKKFKKI